MQTSMVMSIFKLEPLVLCQETLFKRRQPIRRSWQTAKNLHQSCAASKVTKKRRKVQQLGQILMEMKMIINLEKVHQMKIKISSGIVKTKLMMMMKMKMNR